MHFGWGVDHGFWMSGSRVLDVVRITNIGRRVLCAGLYWAVNVGSAIECRLLDRVCAVELVSPGWFRLAKLSDCGAH